MADLVYYCTKENNTCPKKEECKRYLESDNKVCKSTLFKTSCTEHNKHILFIKKEEVKDGEENK